MRDYQPKRNNPYWLPSAVYFQSLYAVRDYDRLRNEYDIILHGSPPSVGDGQPRGTKPTDPVERKAEKLAGISEKLSAIERALDQLPQEYRRGVFNNVRYGTRYPYTASDGTWSRWRRRFLYFVANNLHIL